jgi:hypothetical protein
VILCNGQLPQKIERVKIAVKRVAVQLRVKNGGKAGTIAPYSFGFYMKRDE